MPALVHRILVPEVHRRLVFWILVDVRSLNAQQQRIASLEARAGRPDLDLQRRDFTRLQLLFAPMREHRLVLAGALRIELAVRGAQQSERQMAVLDKGLEGHADQLAGCIELLQPHEDIHVVGVFRRHEQLQFHVADELGRLVERDVEHRP
jgi:hypothetical protein